MPAYSKMFVVIAVFVNLLFVQFVADHDIHFSPEEIECMKEINLDQQQVLDHMDLNSFVINEDIPQIEEFCDCVFKKINVDIKSENPDYSSLEKFLEELFHGFKFKIENKLEFAKDAIKSCKIVQESNKNSIQFRNCIAKYTVDRL